MVVLLAAILYCPVDGVPVVPIKVKGVPPSTLTFMSDSFMY